MAAVLASAALPRRSPDRTGAVARAEPAASRFIDLAFVHHQMRALLGCATADLDVALDDRIAIAIDAVKAAGLISTGHDGG